MADTSVLDYAAISGSRPEAVLLRALQVYPTDPGLAMHRAAEALLLRDVPLAPPVLDLGSSDGSFARLAVAGRVQPRDLVACDLELAALGRSRAVGPHGSVAAADASRLPFRDAVFGTALCNSVLTHVVDLPAVLREVARVLRPCGLLVASVPTPAFGDSLLPARLLAAVGGRRAGEWVAARYNSVWEQRHLLGRAEWRSRLHAAGLRQMSWREYLGGVGGLLWSGWFLLVRAGVGRLRMRALLRRVCPAGTRGTHRFHRILARTLTPYLGPVAAGGSALLVAIREDAL